MVDLGQCGPNAVSADNRQHDDQYLADKHGQREVPHRVEAIFGLPGL